MKTFVRDAFQRDDWSTMRSSIESEESKIQAEAQLVDKTLWRKDVSERSERFEESWRQLLDIEQRILEVSIAQKDISSEHLKVVLDHEQSECLSTFAQVDYEGYKAAVRDRIPGTCDWFVKDRHFQDWLNNKRKFLMVSAGPGCGKSVLTKYLIDSVLPARAKDTKICYFFFRDGQDESMKINKVLCALLHQLLAADQSLVAKHAMGPFNNSRENLIESPTALWRILESAALDESSGDVICVFDALDECNSKSLETLQELLQHHFEKHPTNRRLRFLCTSRPYPDIISNFNPRGALRIQYDESDAIEEDVKRVIKYRVQVSIHPTKSTNQLLLTNLRSAGDSTWSCQRTSRLISRKSF